MRVIPARDAQAKGTSVVADSVLEMSTAVTSNGRSGMQGMDGRSPHRMEHDARGPPAAATPPRSVGAKDSLAKHVSMMQRRQSKERGGPSVVWSHVGASQNLTDCCAAGGAPQPTDDGHDLGPATPGRDGD